MSEEGDIIKTTPAINSSNSILEDSSIKKVLEEKQKKVDMGPRWSEEELDIFLKHFRQSSLKELEIMQSKLAEAGYKRSVNNLIAVYLKNRNFLTSNTGCTAKDLSAIMADHYDAMESEYQMVSEKPTLKLDIEPDNIIDKKRTHTPYGYNSRAYYTDPRARGLDSEYAKRKASKPKKGQSATTDDVYDSLMLKRHTSSEVIPRERPKKPRKTPVHSGKFIVDLNFNNENLFKELEPGFRTCTGKANRKSNNFSLRRQSDDKIFSIPFLYFLECELFYSTIDKPYFSFNELRFLLGNAAEGKKFKRSEWSFLRSCMGKPRRFSSAFIKSQMDDLNNYRNSVRNFLYNKGSLPESKLQSSIIQKAKELQPFQVSQIVLAIHPHCNHIHPGSILTITGSNIIVKFFPSELGAQRVPDSKVLAISTEEAAQISEYFSGSRFRLTGIPMNRSNSDFDEKNPSQNKILQDMDYNALSLFIKILEKKTTLVNELRQFNDTAEGNPSSLNDKFYQEYGWTGVQIKVLDNALKHITTKTRLRGLNNFDPDQLSNNLDSLMTNPLRNLLELDEKKGEDMDPQVVNEIRTLLNKNVEQKIDDQIRSYSAKYSSVQHQELLSVIGGGNKKDDKIEPEKIKEEKLLSPRSQAFRDRIVDDVEEKKKGSLNRMVDNVMGVLLSLKYNNGDLNLKENKYLTDIHSEIFEENSEVFHEINRNLLNICSK